MPDTCLKNSAHARVPYAGMMVQHMQHNIPATLTQPGGQPQLPIVRIKILQWEVSALRLHKIILYKL